MKHTSLLRAASWSLLIALITALGLPMMLGGQVSDTRVSRVQAEIPPNLSLIQQALEKRQKLHLAPGRLQDSNTAVIQNLTSLVESAKGLQDLLAAGPATGEFALIEQEWRDIKSRMVELGLTP